MTDVIPKSRTRTQKSLQQSNTSRILANASVRPGRFQSSIPTFTDPLISSSVEPRSEPPSFLPEANKPVSPSLKRSFSSKDPQLKSRFQNHPASVDRVTASYVEPLTVLYPGIESFQGWLDERMTALTIEKIGEGSYGEVYRASDSSDQTVIFKLIPLRPQKGPGSCTRTPIKEAVNEVKLLEKMSQVPGFVEFRGACVLRGSMPAQLVEQWNAYRTTERSVETDDPNKKRTYPSTQLWLALEMSDAGIDLSHYQPLITKSSFIPPHRSWDIFWQTVKALAKAEIHAEFEHRDLHMGNICIDGTSSKPSESDVKLVPRHEPTPFPFDSTGVRVTIIDYSLARARISDDLILFNNLEEDGGMFDPNNPHNTYNRILEVVGSGKWNESRLETNVMWLSHLLRALLQKTSSARAPRGLKNRCKDQITMNQKMLLVLCEMENMISIKKWRSWTIKSAQDILNAGLSKEWFTVEDIMD